MQMKTKLSDNPRLAKIIYSVIIAVLCITAIIVGIVAANNRDNSDLPSPDNNTLDGGNEAPPQEDNGNQTEEEPKEKITFIAPISGTVTTSHSMTIPVFSPTLEEWRIHTGIDIECEEAASIFAAADGEVIEIGNHPRFGYTLKIRHDGGITTIYSNLASLESIKVKVGDKVKQGDKIATVGDSAIFELADEPHLHFEALQDDKQIDPLSILTEESKKVSLGINPENS